MKDQEVSEWPQGRVMALLELTLAIFMLEATSGMRLHWIYRMGFLVAVMLILTRSGLRSIGLRGALRLPISLLLGLLIGFLLREVMSTELIRDWLRTIADWLSGEIGISASEASQEENAYDSPPPGDYRLPIRSLLLMSGVVFVEELVFRGWLISRLTRIVTFAGVREAGAILLSSILFGVVHYHQGSMGVVSATLGGIVLGSAFLIARRDLWLVWSMHFAYNAADYLTLSDGVKWS